MQALREAIQIWYQSHHRDLPWRHTKDPYAIWLSEIILQQTRVEQGLPYYLKFIHNYPQVQQLAMASQQEVLNLWQGLGYYSRGRNLHATAQQITTDFGSIFPNTYQGLLQLKGVGPYTAAAIASFAYNQPHAVLDGNVFRVLSRYFGVEEPINSAVGKPIFKAAVKGMADVSEEIMKNNNLTADDIAWLVPHQANKRIIDATARRMGVGSEKVMLNIEKYGNTTNGTIPLCLWEWESQLKKGDNLILAAFGGGFTWGSIYLKWAYDSNK